MENINTFLLAGILLMVIVLLISLIYSIKKSAKIINSKIDESKNNIIEAIDKSKSAIEESNKKIIETLNEVTSID